MYWEPLRFPASQNRSLLRTQKSWTRSLGIGPSGSPASSLQPGKVVVILHGPFFQAALPDCPSQKASLSQVPAPGMFDGVQTSSPSASKGCFLPLLPSAFQVTTIVKPSSLPVGHSFVSSHLTYHLPCSEATCSSHLLREKPKSSLWVPSPLCLHFPPHPLSALATPASLLSLEHINHTLTSGPLHWLFPLPETLFPR